MLTRVALRNASRNNAVKVERTATAAATEAPWSSAMRAATWLAPKIVAIRTSAAMPRRVDNLEHAFVFDESDDALQALPGLEVGEDERPLAAHLLRVPIH